VPVPPSPGAEQTPQFHPWLFPELRFGQQLELLLLLARLAEHFAAAAFSTKASKSLDAVKLVVLGAIAAAADYVLRQRATDRTSAITQAQTDPPPDHTPTPPADLMTAKPR
jgi:hypothetical protein